MRGFFNFGHYVMKKGEEEIKDDLDEQSAIRDYLLGNLADETKMRQFEEKIMVDDDFNEKISVAEDELIENYLDGDLTQSQREHFLRFFLILPERQEKLQLIRNLQKYAGKNKTQNLKEPVQEKRAGFFWRQLFSTATVRFAAVILIAGFLVLGVWRVAFYQSDVDRGIAQLRLAYRGQRPVEPRLSVNFDYAPMSETRGSDPAAADQRAYRRAERFLLDATLNETDAQAHHALGLLFLADKKFDEALKEFNLALTLAPDNAALHSDIGATLLEKSKLEEADKKFDESLVNKAKSLEAFNRALEINDSLPEALFNRALILQKMGLAQQAREAWQKYLEKDSFSPWADEARNNLKLLEFNRQQSKTPQQLLQDFFSAYHNADDETAYRIVSRNREMITGKLIPQQLIFLFLEAEGTDKPKYLSAMTYIGELEKNRSRDLFFLDIAKFYAAATPSQMVDLKEANNSVRQGYEQIGLNNHQKALAEFTRARALFEKSKNIWEARFCDYWIGYSLNRLNQIDNSTRILQELSDFCESNKYYWLASHVFGWLANNGVISKDLSGAIEYNRKAIEYSGQVFDLFNEQKSLLQQADVYRRLGDNNEALVFAQKGLFLAAFPESSDRQKWRDFYAVSGIFLAMKLYDAAITYRNESLILAKALRVDSFVYSSYIDLGLIYGTQGKYEEAFSSFDKGRKVAEEFTDEALKKKSNAYADLQTAHIQRQAKDCSQALQNYEKALTFYETGEFQINRYEAHKGRLLCYSETNDDSGFEGELPVILSLFREYRTKILEEQNRNLFFDKEQSVYDIATNYEFEKQNYERAFDYSEESRSRSLLDLQNAAVEISKEGLNPEIKFSLNVAEPLKLSEIRAMMPEDVQIIQYSVLGDKTLIWLLTKEEFSVYKTDISAPALEDKVRKFLALISISNHPQANERDALARELYQILISPVEEKLDGGKKVCLIPDKILFHLSVAALISPGENRFFITKYNLFLSPSANVFLNSSKRARELFENTDETLLSIGNPSFSRKEFADLADLDSAEWEAREISRFYKTTVLLTGKDASKKMVKENLSKADVVHFAGHYVVDQKNPLFSALVLAENVQTREKKDSVLANYEIFEGKLSDTQLIVLSACETGVERFYEGEGMIGAARTFLALGVPVIVASQWKVDSDSTAELMIRFHRYRKLEKLSTPAALRRAQIDLLEGENTQFRNPYYWAAFIPFGGFSEF